MKSLSDMTTSVDDNLVLWSLKATMHHSRDCLLGFNNFKEDTHNLTLPIAVHNEHKIEGQSQLI